MRYVIANLKMNQVSVADVDRYLVSFEREWVCLPTDSVQTIVCPSFPLIREFREKLPSYVAVGAQNSFWEERGAYTGEVSPALLADMKTSFVLLGHSERRHMGETDEVVAKKISACLSAGLRPILCVGETSDDRNNNQTFEVILRQIEIALADVLLAQIDRILIAYEPVWAIGTDRTPSAHDIMKVATFIRRFFLKKFNDEAIIPSIVYGGSVSADLIEEVCIRPGLSGVLVGRESLIPHELACMVKKLSDV